MKFEELQEDVILNEKLKYAFKQIRLHWKDPNWWKGRFMTYIVRNIINKYWERIYPKEKSVFIMEED